MGDPHSGTLQLEPLRGRPVMSQDPKRKVKDKGGAGEGGCGSGSSRWCCHGNHQQVPTSRDGRTLSRGVPKLLGPSRAQKSQLSWPIPTPGFQCQEPEAGPPQLAWCAQRPDLASLQCARQEGPFLRGLLLAASQHRGLPHRPLRTRFPGWTVGAGLLPDRDPQEGLQEGN